MKNSSSNKTLKSKIDPNNSSKGVVVGKSPDSIGLLTLNPSLRLGTLSGLGLLWGKDFTAFLTALFLAIAAAAVPPDAVALILGITVPAVWVIAWAVASTTDIETLKLYTLFPADVSPLVTPATTLSGFYGWLVFPVLSLLTIFPELSESVESAWITSIAKPK